MSELLRQTIADLKALVARHESRKVQTSRTIWGAYDAREMITRLEKMQ